MVVERAARLGNDVAAGVSRPGETTADVDHPHDAQSPVDTSEVRVLASSAVSITWSAVSA